MHVYLNLIKQNRNFRNLWLSQISANFGDWFGVLAVFAVLMQYSDSEFLLGLVIIIKMMSFAVFAPLAGYIVDRFNRRRMMVAAHIGRGIVVSCFLFVQSAELIWLLYVITSLQMMLASIFEPARQATIPNITTREELVQANVLSNITWSIIFTTGMAIGGFATELLGTDMVFIINALGYVVATGFMLKSKIPAHKEDELKPGPWEGVKLGFGYLRDHKEVLRPAIAKGSYNLFLGGLVYMLILIAEEILLLGSIGLGLLYAARGLGTAVGPIVGRKVIPDERQWITFTGLLMIATGGFYFLSSWITFLPLLLFTVFLAHCWSGANWVFSTVLIQKRSDDRYRGRVFSAEFQLLTILNSLSIFLASMLLETGVLALNQTVMVFAGGLALTGILWQMTIAIGERRYHRYNSVKDYRDARPAVEPLPVHSNVK